MFDPESDSIFKPITVSSTVNGNDHSADGDHFGHSVIRGDHPAEKNNFKEFI